MATRIRGIVVLSGLVAAMLIPQQAGMAEEDTTSTSASTPDNTELGGMPADELAWYAEDKGVSLEAAIRMIQAETDLSLFADQIRHQPWYAGFKIVTQGETVSGVLAVTGNPVVQIPPGLSVEIQTARLGESDYPGFQDSMKARLQDRVADLVAVTYEPFEDVVLVWRTADSAAISAAEASTIEAWTRDELDGRFDGVAVRIVTSPAVEFADGDQPAVAVKAWPLIILGLFLVGILWLSRGSSNALATGKSRT